MGRLSDWFDALPIVDVTDEVDARKVTTDKGQRTFRWQVGFLRRVHPSGRRVDVQIRVEYGDGESPLVPGVYVIDGMSFDTGRFGDLELKRYDKVFTAVPDEILRLVEQDQKRQAA